MEILQNLVTTLEAQHASKADYVVPSKLLVMKDGQLHAQGRAYKPNEVCHEGLSDKLSIPLTYYRRMRAERPELLDLSVNHWLQHQSEKNMLLRTFEGLDQNIARAFLSDRYMALDNYDVLFTVLDAIKSMGVNVEIKNADVTEKRLYLNVVAPEVEIQATELLKHYLQSRSAVGNGVISGFTISNSEVGMGSFMIRPRAVICKCDNGIIRPDDTFSKIHLGGKLEQGVVKWSKETQKRNLQLVMSQVKDAIKTFLSKDYLGMVVKDLERAHNINLENPVDAVQHACKDLKYNDEQRKSILDFFVKGGDLKGSGIVHAITQHAQTEDADTRNDMELDAFQVITRLHSFDKPFTNN